MIENIRDKEDFYESVAEDHDLLMVLFYTESSEKSNRSLQALEHLKQENSDLNIYKIDAKQVPDIHPQFGIKSVPTLLTFRNGQQAEIITGVQTEGFYAKLLQKFDISRGNGNGQTHRVTVYTTPTCPHCDSVKRYLSSNNVSYSEIDVSADEAAAKELVERTGQQGVPQTEIDGKFVIGYDTNQLDRLLNL